jgi:polysaccharide export outer membrane protein
MPGDRVVVYRDPIVRGTIFLDRLVAPFQTVLQSILQTSFTIRAIDYAKLGATGLGGVGGGATGARTQPTLLSQPGAR